MGSWRWSIFENSAVHAESRHMELPRINVTFLLLTLPTVPSPPHTIQFLPPSPTVPHVLFPHPRCVKSLQGRLGTEGRRRGTIAHDMRDMTAPSASLHQNPRLQLSIAQVSPSLCRNAGTHATALPSLPCTDRLRRGGTTRLRGHWIVDRRKWSPRYELSPILCRPAIPWPLQERPRGSPWVHNLPFLDPRSQHPR